MRIGSVVDASGRRITLLDPGVSWLLGRHEQIDKATHDRIMAELGVEASAGRRTILLGIGLVALLCVLAVTGIAIDIAIEGRTAFQDLVGSLVFTGPAFVMTVAVGVVVPIMRARKRRLARTTEVMLRNGHCPHCGYRIAEVPRQPGTGQTICPECSSAWLLPQRATPSVKS